VLVCWVNVVTPVWGGACGAGKARIRTARAGTLLYFSPELLNRKPYNSKADCFNAIITAILTLF